jgi:MYXO-CTERM domain-containing protein
MFTTKGLLFILGAAGIALTGAMSQAAPIASDSASNYVSLNGFNGDNQGTGFGAWNVSYSYTGPSGGGGGGGSFLNTTSGLPGADAFDIYVYPGTGGDTGLNTDITTATRSFNSALTAGETFTTDLYLNNGNQNSSLANTNPSTADSNLGFALLDSKGNVLFSMIAFGGGEYWASDATNGGAYFEPASGNILYNYHADDTFAFDLLNSQGEYSMTVSGNTGTGSPVTFAGQINMATGGPSAVEYIDNNGGNGSDVQWSTMSIAATPTPEPTSLAIAGVAVGGLLLLRRRRPA